MRLRSSWLPVLLSPALFIGLGSMPAFSQAMATQEQLLSCKNNVLSRLNTNNANIEVTPGSRQPNGDGLVNWRLRDSGRTGSCILNRRSEIVNFQQDQSSRPTATRMATQEQLLSCKNTALSRLNTNNANIQVTPGTRQPNGDGLVNWKLRDSGRSGFCILNQRGQILNFGQEQSLGSTPTNLREAFVDTRGGTLMIRSGPGGDVIGEAPDGARLLVTNERNGEWVKLHKQGWVSERFIWYSGKTY